MSAEELKAFMARHALLQTDLAKLLGVTDMAIHQWLHARRGISLPVARLLRLFDKHPSLMKEFGK